MSLVSSDDCACYRDDEKRLSLDPCYDSALSSGYRDVMINICIKTPETKSLGVQHHVAELQLILREVYECRTTRGANQTHVLSRNLRGQ